MCSLLSFVVPAHNEAFEIGRTLQSIRQAAAHTSIPFEIIVVNDASSDQTAEIARHAGAQVVEVKFRKISASRNAGAKQAKGDVLIFVDADTQISAPVLSAVVTAITAGAVGGGAWVTFAEPVQRRIQVAMDIFSFFYMKILGWAAGCFVFARRSAFEKVGGFDESLFACEEIALSVALKRQGRFVVLREAVSTSARKMRIYSPWRIFPLLARFLVKGPAVFRHREGLEWWYEGRREK